MRSIITIVGLSLVLGLASIVACNDGGNPDIIINRDPDTSGGGGTPGTGEDPGKQAGVCYPAFEDDELNVVTWNIENFPLSSTTQQKARAIIEDMDADIIAVQEIDEPAEFLALGNSLQEWDAYYHDVNLGLELGYLVKRNSFTSVGTTSKLFTGNTSAFPREAVRIDVTHTSGLEVIFLNIHLKCCGEQGSSDFNRRVAASEALQAYIDQNLSDKAVIVLGDWNDDLQETNSAFENFKNAPANYQFADMSIALGSTSNFSYPSWPSHLDHILITNELFDKLGDVMTIKPESCVSGYSSSVSDHRPVLASFK
ncbi:MAG: endonuclease/exonuclease/phosphatase family protein [Cyclobacteriaceae bacterium]